MARCTELAFPVQRIFSFPVVIFFGSSGVELNFVNSLGQ
jgi:hypothetical protein